MHNKLQYMARIALSLLMPLVMVAMTGCSDDEIDGGLTPDAEAGYISINLNASKNSRAADDTRNEDLIKSVVICLYPNGGATAPSTPTHVEFFDHIDKNQTHSVKIKLNKTLATNLFGDGDGSCTAYVIANLPDADAKAITVSTPLEDLKKIVINPDFATMQEQPSFVMDGSTTVTRSGAGTNNDKASGTIRLVRSASKISLAVRVASQYVAPDGTVWTPNADNISVLINNGVTRSQIESSSYTPQPADYYQTHTNGDADHRNRTFTKDANADPKTGYPYLLTSPFYTFPNSWNPDEVESPMTYMTLIVPWKRGDEDRYRTCYYMVPIIKGNRLDRNIAYSVKLNVNVLGSFTPDIPMKLTDLSYYAVEWGEVGMDVDITDSRYLVVDSHNYIMNNDTHISIPVYTSHKTTIRDITMTYYRYNTNGDKSDEFPVKITKTVIDDTNNDATNKANNAVFCTYDFKNTGAGVNQASVEFSHDLNLWVPYRQSGYRLVEVAQNQLPTYAGDITLYRPADSSDEAYSRYEIAITFQHEDIDKESDNFKETVNIVQYPRMYIRNTLNTGGNMVNGIDRGYVYVNNNQYNTTEGADQWNVVRGLNGNNKNNNMYVIFITQFDNNVNYYYIGDPRATLINNNLSNNSMGKENTSVFSNCASIDGIKLENYYPTDESDDKTYYVAPEMRIASSYGVCNNAISREKARQRCATYQERNYPAGRWRIPTKGELEFILSLSLDGKIPTLFNTNSTYWTAQGYVTTKLNSDRRLGNTSTTGNAFVRCVYDEWYWKGKELPGTSDFKFTWGDEPKMNSL